MSIALTYEILGRDDLTPVLIVVIVRTVVIPKKMLDHEMHSTLCIAKKCITRLKCCQRTKELNHLL